MDAKTFDILTALTALLRNYWMSGSPLKNILTLAWRKPPPPPAPSTGGRPQKKRGLDFDDNESTDDNSVGGGFKFPPAGKFLYLLLAYALAHLPAFIEFVKKEGKFSNDSLFERFITDAQTHLSTPNSSSTDFILSFLTDLFIHMMPTPLTAALESFTGTVTSLHQSLSQHISDATARFNHPAPPPPQTPSATDIALVHRTSAALISHANDRKAKVDLVGPGLNSLPQTGSQEQLKSALKSILNNAINASNNPADSKAEGQRLLAGVELTNVQVFPSRGTRPTRVTVTVAYGKKQSAPAQAQDMQTDQPLYHQSRSNLFKIGNLLRGPKQQPGSPPRPPPEISVFENRSLAQTTWFKGAQAAAQYAAQAAAATNQPAPRFTTRAHRLFFSTIGADGKVQLGQEVLPNTAVVGQVAALLDRR